MKKVKILYADDEFINLELFKFYLQEKYEVLTAESGSMGLELLMKEHEVQVVISDMKMPQMTGLEFIRSVKMRHPKMKCMILTGYGMTSEIEESLEDGLIETCMHKPFELKKVDREIEKVLASKKE